MKPNIPFSRSRIRSTTISGRGTPQGHGPSKIGGHTQPRNRPRPHRPTPSLRPTTEPANAGPGRPSNNAVHPWLAEYISTNSAKREHCHHLSPERRQRPKRQKWQSWAQTLPLPEWINTSLSTPQNAFVASTHPLSVTWRFETSHIPPARALLRRRLERPKRDRPQGTCRPRPALAPGKRQKL